MDSTAPRNRRRLVLIWASTAALVIGAVIVSVLAIGGLRDGREARADAQAAGGAGMGPVLESQIATLRSVADEVSRRSEEAETAATAEAEKRRAAEEAEQRAAEEARAAQTTGTIPGSCEELYPESVRSALQEQGFVPTTGGRPGTAGVLTADTPANQIADDRLAFQCGLAVEGAGGEALQTRVSSGLTPEERDYVIGVLGGGGFGCSELLGGTWCSTSDESHFLRDGFWMATAWTYAPDGYTPLVAGAIWGE